MTNLVPTDEIEGLVGARRHPTAHLGRADSAGQTVYILHSRLCKNSGIDLRECVYSRSLDRGIDTHNWRPSEDRAVTLMVAPGLELMPDPDGPDDIELIEAGAE